MTKRFNKAYDVLVQAFFNGTLAKGDCKCCAVGNIVAGAYGATIEIHEGTATCSMINHLWKALFCTSWGIQAKRVPYYGKTYIEEALYSIEATGYSEEELAKVEYAFETNTNIHIEDYCKNSEQDILEDQYNGLCAVFDVLCELDNIPKEPKYSNKLKEKEGLVLA